MNDTNRILPDQDTRPKVPDYHSELFVNRSSELALIKKKVAALRQGERVHRRTICFWGYKGSGRTWLLRHIAHELGKEHDVEAAYVDLATVANRPVGEATQAVLVQLAELLTYTEY